MLFIDLVPQLKDSRLKVTHLDLYCLLFPFLLLVHRLFLLQLNLGLLELMF